MSKRRIVLGLITAITGLAAVGIVAANPVAHSEVHTQTWSFNGFFGSFDQAQLKRGHVIYKDVCSGCHSKTTGNQVHATTVRIAMASGADSL